VDAHEQRAARAHQRHGRQLQRPLRRALALAHLGNLDEGSQNLTTGRNLIDTPEFSGYSSLDWTPNTVFSGSLSAQYTGKQTGTDDLPQGLHAV
jgi:outer membrane receptor for ferrienterochelin and colicin